MYIAIQESHKDKSYQSCPPFYDEHHNEADYCPDKSDVHRVILERWSPAYKEYKQLTEEVDVAWSVDTTLGSGAGNWKPETKSVVQIGVLLRIMKTPSYILGRVGSVVFCSISSNMGTLLCIQLHYFSWLRSTWVCHRLICTLNSGTGRNNKKSQ